MFLVSELSYSTFMISEFSFYMLKYSYHYEEGREYYEKKIVNHFSMYRFLYCFWSYKEVFATFKPIDQYELNKELKNKSIENLTHNEMKKVGEHFVTEQLSVFEFTNKEDVKRKGEELFLNRGYEQLMGNIIQIVFKI